MEALVGVMGAGEDDEAAVVRSGFGDGDDTLGELELGLVGVLVLVSVKVSGERRSHTSHLTTEARATSSGQSSHKLQSRGSRATSELTARVGSARYRCDRARHRER